jgi:hypothetical protein
MHKFKKISVALLVMMLPLTLHAQQIEAQLQKTGRKGQSILFSALPIFILSIAYLYKRGKPEAQDRMEKLVMGGLLVATAFGWSYFFK